MKLIKTVLFLVLLLSSNLTFAKEIPVSARQAKVVQVIDGDTIIVELDRQREHVRLIGIDTPESRPNKRAQIQASNRHVDQRTILALGHRSSEHARQLMPKKSFVNLEFDTERRDHYGRLLAYVWVQNQAKNGAIMVNEEILRSGFGYLLTVPPNVRYRDRLTAAFKDARQARRGLWGE